MDHEPNQIPSPTAQSDAIVVCVVVTYNPAQPRLEQLLQSVAPQVGSIILVDNGSSFECLQWLRRLIGSSISLVELGSNQGIAAAQNAGLAQARRAGCSHVLLLDHDSVPARSMVADLFHALASLGPRGARVAALGPRYVDARQDSPPPFIRIEGLRLVRCKCPTADTVVEVDYLISSGSLIPLATLDVVGGMAEELFIDYVDIEWGLRAKRLGYQSYGVCAARMAHDLGETPVTFMGRSLPVHSAVRHYYHFRNAVWLYRSAAIPLQWKCADGWRLLLKYGFYTLYAKPRLAHLGMMSRGILDGLRGRLGPMASRQGRSAAGTHRR